MFRDQVRAAPKRRSAAKIGPRGSLFSLSRKPAATARYRGGEVAVPRLFERGSATRRILQAGTRVSPTVRSRQPPSRARRDRRLPAVQHHAAKPDTLPESHAVVKKGRPKPACRFAINESPARWSAAIGKQITAQTKLVPSTRKVLTNARRAEPFVLKSP